MNKHTSVIPRNLCIVFKGNEVLLLKGNSKKIHWANMYNALGGHIEKGEELHFSAIRETFEESGIKISPKKMSLKGIIHVKTYFNEDVFMFIFVGKIANAKIIESREGSLKWFKISELSRIENIAEDIKVIIPLVKKMKKGKIISGVSEYNKDKKLIKFDISIFNI